MLCLPLLLYCAQKYLPVTSLKKNHVLWEEQPGKKPSCSQGQNTFHAEPAQGPFSTTERRTWTLPFASAEDGPRETPPQPGSIHQRSHISLDDLWLEKTQRRKLKKQFERKMHAHKDGVPVSCSDAIVSRLSLVPPLPRQWLAFISCPLPPLCPSTGCR
uniref:Uncharacterized protein n=1 Tax=Sus scrofa TaxID=9823 RepID=A0A8D0ZWM1_PIG